MALPPNFCHISRTLCLFLPQLRSWDDATRNASRSVNYKSSPKTMVRKWLIKGRKHALWSAVPPTAQAHRRSGCMGWTVPPASLRSSKLIPVAAPVRSCAPFLRFLKTSFGWTMAMAAVRMVGLAATLWVCLGELSTWRCDAYIIILRAPGLSCDGASIFHLGWVGPWEWRRGWTRGCMRVCERATRWQEAWRADLADPPWRHAATPDLPTPLHMLCPLVAHSLWCIIHHRFCDARHALGSASCLSSISWHYIEPIQHSQELSCRMLLANCCIHSHTFPKGHAFTCLFASSLLFQWFCSRFCFSFLTTFFFVTSTFDGFLGNSGFAYFCLLFSYFTFSRFWEFLVLVACCEFSVFEKFSFGLDRPQWFSPFSRNSRSCWCLFCQGTLGTAPRYFTSLRPHPNKRHPTVHPTTLDSPFPPQPHTTYSSPYPPLAHSTPQSHTW